MTPVISVKNLEKTYDMGEVSVRALRSVSLDIENGEFVTVVGPSGSGKSTLMHILGCLDQPTKGQYLLEGRDVSRLSDDEISRIRNQQIGFVFQGFNLLARTSALENVELPLLYGKESISSAERKKRAWKLSTRLVWHRAPSIIPTNFREGSNNGSQLPARSSTSLRSFWRMNRRATSIVGRASRSWISFNR